MDNAQLQTLIGKYLDGTADACEAKLVEEWYQGFESNPGITEGMSEKTLSSAMDQGFMMLMKSISLAKENENKSDPLP